MNKSISDFAINDYAEIDFKSSWVELSIAKPNPSMPANAYLVYVQKGHFELENLQNRDQVEVSLCEEFKEATAHDEVRSGSGDDLLSGQGAIKMAAETDELAGTLLHLKGTIPTTQHEQVEYEIGARTQKLSNLLQIRISNLDMTTVNLIRSQIYGMVSSQP